MKKCLFRYLKDIKHVEEMMDGHILFRSLNYFQQVEDDQARQDGREGLVSNPAKGYNYTQRRSFDLSETHEFSCSIQSGDIFVYCLSQYLTTRLCREFGAKYVVKIRNRKRDVFFRRIKKNLPHWAQLPEWKGRDGDGWRIARPVIYDKSASGVIHAIPAEIAIRKPPEFEYQQELGRLGCGVMRR